MPKKKTHSRSNDSDAKVVRLFDDARLPTAPNIPNPGIHLRRDSKGTTIVTENRLKPGPLEI